MPGPKMGPRPADFDEEGVRQSPRFLEWLELHPGQKFKYACREFVKGKSQDEERLMRRIMIARRNNLRDHAVLKIARQKVTTTKSTSCSSDDNNSEQQIATATAKTAATTATQAKTSASTTTNPRKRRPPSTFSDSQVAQEMDIPAVEATRTYKCWMAMPDGAELSYNQKYIKGKEGHDWLLRKNIWRRMRYRRENKKIIQQLKDVATTTRTTATATLPFTAASANIVSSSITRPQTTNRQNTPSASAIVEQAVLPQMPTSSNIPNQQPEESNSITQPRADTDMDPPSLDPLAAPSPVALVVDAAGSTAPGPPSAAEDVTDISHEIDHDRNHQEDAVAAAAATASAHSHEDLVEISAVEAAVAAAESYVKLEHMRGSNRDDDDDDMQDDDDDDDHSVSVVVVHNPLEAAAHAAHSAALDSAARLAAAAAQSNNDADVMTDLDLVVAADVHMEHIGSGDDDHPHISAV